MTTTPDWAEKLARETAMSLPPSDFGSHRAIQAFAAALRAVAGQTQPISTAPMDGAMFLACEPGSPVFVPVFRALKPCGADGDMPDAGYWVAVIGCPEDGGRGIDGLSGPLLPGTVWLPLPRPNGGFRQSDAAAQS